MTIKSVIWIKKKKFYLHSKGHYTWEEAYKLAKEYKKEIKTTYFIIKYEEGYVFPETYYALYLTKVKPIWQV